MPLLTATGLSTSFLTDRGQVRAVDGVDLTLDSGRVLGLVGESGSGKSVLVRSIMGLYRNDARVVRGGSVVLAGRDLTALSARQLRDLWGPEIAIVFQDPMSALNPVMRIGRQITEMLRHHLGVPRSAAGARAVELLASVGMPDPERRAREYPHQLSGGLRQRVAIAIALSCEPKLLIADEPTTALDVTIQAQILRLLQDQQRQRQMAVILVSHDFGVVASLADEIAVMYAGHVVERGGAGQVIDQPEHPYTSALIASMPRLEVAAGQRLTAIGGRAPNLLTLQPGCPFETRCGRAVSRCAEERPALTPGDSGHWRACWNPVPDGELARAAKDGAE
jgi:oligopeptide/dipeptide ABC transporter ATP-binding protein